jgi:peptidoglycan/LPS O-acetylase OafA/YrhL
LPKCLLFANEFAPPSILDHTWSLAVEEKFYVVWPLLAFWLLRHRPRTRTVIAAVLAGVPFVVRLLIQVGAAPQAWEFPHQSRWLYGGYSSILIGCLLAIALDNRETYERVVRALRFTIPILLAYVITLLTLRDWWLSLGLYPWVSGALVGAAAVSKARPLAWLRSRALRLCGALSYGLYLFHVLVVVWVEHALGFTTIERPWNFAPLLLCVAISFPVAYLLHRTIETPAVAFGRRIAGHPALAPAEADS